MVSDGVPQLAVKLFMCRPLVGFYVNFNAVVELYAGHYLAAGGASRAAPSYTYSWQQQSGRLRCSPLFCGHGFRHHLQTIMDRHDLLADRAESFGIELKGVTTEYC